MPLAFAVSRGVIPRPTRLPLPFAARCPARPQRTTTFRRHILQPCMQFPQDATERLVTFCENRGVERDLARRVVTSARTAAADWATATSEFLTPPESVALLTAVKSLASVHVLAWGGYEEAERRALFVAHSDVAETAEDFLKQLADSELRLLRIAGTFEFDKASHRDFMGAVLNAGVSRQKVGDILVLESRGADVIVHKDVADVLAMSLETVRQTKVSVDILPTSEVELPEKRVKEIQSVENSMRLDAVVSAGFNLSRSKLAGMVRSGLVQVNYREMKSPAKSVKTGDVVSVRGIGKLEIGDVSTTSKGRFRVMMKKFV